MNPEFVSVICAYFFEVCIFADFLSLIGILFSALSLAVFRVESHFKWICIMNSLVIIMFCQGCVHNVPGVCVYLEYRYLRIKHSSVEFGLRASVKNFTVAVSQILVFSINKAQLAIVKNMFLCQIGKLTVFSHGNLTIMKFNLLHPRAI